MSDELVEIKARWFTDQMHHPNYWADLASRDVPWLISEVERLRGNSGGERIQAVEAATLLTVIRDQAAGGLPPGLARDKTMLAFSTAIQCLLADGARTR